MTPEDADKLEKFLETGRRILSANQALADELFFLKANSSALLDVVSKAISETPPTPATRDQFLAAWKQSRAEKIQQALINLENSDPTNAARLSQMANDGKFEI